MVYDTTCNQLYYRLFNVVQTTASTRSRDGNANKNIFYTGTTIRLNGLVCMVIHQHRYIVMAGWDLQSAGSGIGALMGIAGGIESAITGSKDAKDIANIQQQMAQTEIQENAVRRTAMEVTSRRQQTQNIRQSQMARSMALTNATG